MVGFGIFRLVSLLMKCFVHSPTYSGCDGNEGLVFHPLFCMVFIIVSYLVCLCVRARSGNLSWQYVNLMSWIASVGEGDIGVWVWFEAPIMHKMFDLDLAW
jgi:hypothetical protein